MSTAGGRGPGRPRKLPAAEQRERVLEAACQAFAAHGRQGTTIEEIARLAGLTRQAVYEQFDDKNALFDEVVAHVEDLAYTTIAAQGEGDADLGLKPWARRNFATLFAFVAEHPEAKPILDEAERTGNPALTRLRARLAEVYTKASRQRWVAHGMEPGRADTALVTMYFAMTEALVGLSWDGPAPDREALIDLLTEFTVGGVLRLHRQSPDVIARVRGSTNHP